MSLRTECSPTEFLKIAAHTAEHFGFRTIETLQKDPLCKNCTVTVTHNICEIDHTIDAANGLITRGFEKYLTGNLHALGAPVLLYSVDNTENAETAISFHIFNVQKSIAEAILIQASRALVTELGYTDHIVRINSLGDSESITRYSRELTNYLRKRLDTMSPAARELMKVHALRALEQLVIEQHELAYKTPNPLEYLSDQSRKHFRDIIEYLDMSDTPYEIDPKMLGNHECYSDALFAIDILGDAPAGITVRGGRFDEFVERKTKKRGGAVGAAIILKERPAPARTPRFKGTDPSVYIIQLGFGPKIRSLMIIDQLRKEGIPVHQDLANDSLSAQLRDAEARGVKHVIIIGQKEFVDGTVILRDMQARKQEPITYDMLLKKLKRGAQVTA